ncbi:MAG: hypothetical protein JWR02_3027 [Mucilaginibacter sp.]|nr:hypothetical protein [Mucilaginibacter sp.]
MKNKKLTYVLCLAVLAVWGIIIYRLFDAAGGSDDNPIHVTSGQRPKEPYNDYALPKDTAHLLLNYRDPFHLVKMKDTAQTPSKKVNHKIMMAAKPAFNWSFIKYSGYIHNPVSRKLIALVIINGKNVMLSEGDTKEQVRLIRNLRDSIKIGFNGQTKFITKSAAL